MGTGANMCIAMHCEYTERELSLHVSEAIQIVWTSAVLQTCLEDGQAARKQTWTKHNITL